MRTYKHTDVNTFRKTERQNTYKYKSTPTTKPTTDVEPDKENRREQITNNGGSNTDRDRYIGTDAHINRDQHIDRDRRRDREP